MTTFFPFVFLPVIAVVYGVGILFASLVAGFGFRVGWDFAGRHVGQQPPTSRG